MTKYRIRILTSYDIFDQVVELALAVNFHLHHGVLEDARLCEHWLRGCGVDLEGDAAVNNSMMQLIQNDTET